MFTARDPDSCPASGNKSRCVQCELEPVVPVSLCAGRRRQPPKVARTASNRPQITSPLGKARFLVGADTGYSILMRPRARLRRTRGRRPGASRAPEGLAGTLPYLILRYRLRAELPECRIALSAFFVSKLGSPLCSPRTERCPSMSEISRRTRTSRRSKAVTIYPVARRFPRPSGGAAKPVDERFFFFLHFFLFFFSSSLVLL